MSRRRYRRGTQTGAEYWAMIEAQTAAQEELAVARERDQYEDDDSETLVEDGVENIHAELFALDEELESDTITEAYQANEYMRNLMSISAWEREGQIHRMEDAHGNMTQALVTMFNLTRLESVEILDKYL